MATSMPGSEERKKLAELIEDIQFAMLTTQEPDGTLRSRPMTTQQQEFDGDLWFFVGASGSTAREVQRDQQVNLSYAKPDKNIYVSVSGRASLVRDRQKLEELWNPVYKAWFPDGLDDPNLALLRVEATQAEYWDAPNGKVVQALGFAKALLTGKSYEGAENEKLDLEGR
jgi:general stress protein 26